MKQITENRRGFLAYIVVLAAAFAAAEWVGNGPAAAVRSFAIIVGGWLLILYLPWSGFALLRPARKDEREGSIGMESAAITGIVVTWVAVLGGMVDMAKGGDGGAFALVAAVAGATFLACMLILPRVR